MISTGELLVVLAVALLVFGPDKLPQVARSFGESVYELKKALREDGREKPAG